jgi:hypothetical protein
MTMDSAWNSTPLASRQRGKLYPVQGDGPLVGGDHRNLALESLPHVRNAGLPISGRASCHLHQQVGL